MKPPTIASRLRRLLRARAARVFTREPIFDQEDAEAARRFGKQVWEEAKRAARETGHAYQEGVTGRNPLREAYHALEVPYGSSWLEVRASYRKLIRVYHPDRHAGDEEKQAAATKIMQRLNHAYAVLKEYHGQD